MTALMIQGTGTDVGKSLVVAGLCRAFTRRGLSVRPFKSQNMSNNAAVACDGGEIGRAQALQACACGVEPSVDMNPVLLKPESETGAQVIVRGQRRATTEAFAYQSYRESLLPEVLESFARLEAGCDLVLVEGAGSASEVNLRAGDIANWGFAEAAGVPVVLLGDIDRGGVIASLVGTAALLSASEAALVRGYIVNKFRGDLSLFDGGLEAISQHTGWRSFGVLRYLPEARRLPAEDAIAAENLLAAADRPIRVAVPLLPRISNVDDLDPLIAEPDVSVDFVPPGRALPGDADLVVLPGSKATLSDLAFLRREGWDVDIAAHLRRGGWLLGLCGGYQMLGGEIADPEGLEGAAGAVPGLGFLDISTRLSPEKRLERVTGRCAVSGVPVEGYEIHLGQSQGEDRARPLLEIAGAGEGAVSRDGRVMGSYLHGLFTADDFRHAFLSRLRGRRSSGVSYWRQVEDTLDLLAERMEAELDLDGLLAAARR